jgi:hypothetical protein
MTGYGTYAAGGRGTNAHRRAMHSICTPYAHHVQSQVPHTHLQGLPQLVLAQPLHCVWRQRLCQLPMVHLQQCTNTQTRHYCVAPASKLLRPLSTVQNVVVLGKLSLNAQQAGHSSQPTH